MCSTRTRWKTSSSPARQAEDGVLEERERDHVGDAEFPVEVVASLEQISRRRRATRACAPQLLDAARGPGAALELVGDQVRGPLPELVEPVDEDLHLGAPRGVARVERRLGMPALQPLENARGVGDDLVAVDEHRHEPLAAHRLDRRPVVRVDVDPFELDTLVARGERDALDVRRERDPVDARRDAAR